MNRLTPGAGADLVVEVAGSTLNRSLDAVAFGGTVSVIGSVGGTSAEPFNARSLYDRANEALTRLDSGAHFGKVVIRI